MQYSETDRTKVAWEELARQLDAVSRAYAELYSIERTPEWHVMKICEESGELMQWFLASIGQGRTRGKTPAELTDSVDDEIADVVCHAILMAYHRGTDLGEVITRKWLRAVETPSGTGSPAVADRC
ncbi:pyrophosphatase [Nocardia brasiliensis]|uniref:pyrophosphatase n=1 Tax=Nocardia brasiliensis TaxID=37326 RepID=UPI00245636A4|nr:pyrophosphatase [Nocardia brasiliensis]